MGRGGEEEGLEEEDSEEEARKRGLAQNDHLLLDDGRGPIAILRGPGLGTAGSSGRGLRAWEGRHTEERKGWSEGLCR